MEFSSSSIKKLIIFAYILENGTFQSKLEKIKKILSEKISYTSGKWKFPTLILKNFLYFVKRKPRKKSLYFRKRNFLIFQETKLFYISGKVNSESWYNQNPDISRTRSIFRTLVYLQPETYSDHCETSTMECFAKIAT